MVYTLKNRMPKEFTFVDFGYPVSNSWLRPYITCFWLILMSCETPSLANPVTPVMYKFNLILVPCETPSLANPVTPVMYRFCLSHLNSCVDHPISPGSHDVCSIYPSPQATFLCLEVQYNHFVPNAYVCVNPCAQ